MSSSGRIPSRWETIDSQNLDSQPSQPKRSLPKRKDARLGTYSRSQASSSTSKPFWNIPYISQIPNIMRPFVEEIVNVKGDGHCGFWVIARHLGKPLQYETPHQRDDASNSISRNHNFVSAFDKGGDQGST